ncbi:hypothetical protein E2C01_051210 [Portunus trituberculatus]|uniref:Uncharacterized protein n=1 Tax=Portunus trituberculatus TaxID=210409 RepID=A0A5B7GIG5_PORTR|nr:hypothetical protein [Portunus trituberculatus]
MKTRHGTEGDKRQWSWHQYGEEEQEAEEEEEDAHEGEEKEGQAKSRVEVRGGEWRGAGVRDCRPQSDQIAPTPSLNPKSVREQEHLTSPPSAEPCRTRGHDRARPRVAQGGRGRVASLSCTGSKGNVDGAGWGWVGRCGTGQCGAGRCCARWGRDMVCVTIRSRAHVLAQVPPRVGRRKASIVSLQTLIYILNFESIKSPKRRTPASRQTPPRLTLPRAASVPVPYLTCTAIVIPGGGGHCFGMRPRLGGEDQRRAL